MQSVFCDAQNLYRPPTGKSQQVLNQDKVWDNSTVLLRPTKCPCKFSFRQACTSCWQFGGAPSCFKNFHFHKIHVCHCYHNLMKHVLPFLKCLYTFLGELYIYHQYFYVFFQIYISSSRTYLIMPLCQGVQQIPPSQTHVYLSNNRRTQYCSNGQRNLISLSTTNLA